MSSSRTVGWFLGFLAEEEDELLGFSESDGDGDGEERWSGEWPGDESMVLGD